jgi:hypothetical protein
MEGGGLKGANQQSIDPEAKRAATREDELAENDLLHD